MKYINKEYGFAFRPPFQNRFSEIKETGPDKSKILFPNQYMQGVGYDYSAINGAMLIGKHGTLWGIRVSYFNGASWLENEDFMQSLGHGCASTVDGSFAHFSSGPLSVQWVKHNEQGMVVKVSAHKKLRIRIIFYPCHNWHGELSIEEQCVKGRSPYVGILAGDIRIGDNNAIYKDRYRVILDDSDERECFFAKSYTKPSDSANGAFNEAIMEFVINKEQPNVYLYATVGDEDILGAEVVPPLDRVINQIETAALRYGVDRTHGSGVLGSPAERMQNSVHWSRIYYPYLLTEIYSPKRGMLDNHFNLDGLDENCGALLGCFAGGARYASKQLKYTVEDKIFSILTVWHIFCHSSNKASLKSIYKSLCLLYEPEASLVVTTSADKNEVAYKWGDSPLKEKKDSSPMYSLDLSCIKLLAFDVLAKLADYYNEPEASKDYSAAYVELKELINDVFWSDRDGMYINRYVSNKWAGSNSIGATSFYVLICNAVDSSERLSLIINNLLNHKKFWTTYGIPTISADNKEYGKRGRPNNNGFRSLPYLEFRGSVVPYINYIIYHGLVRYGMDEIAARIAYNSSKLWADNKSDNVENYSVYLPTGKRVKSKNYLSTNGNMLAMIGIQELIDIEYFKSDIRKDAIRFGTFALGDHSVSNLKLLGKTYGVEIRDTETTLLYNNNMIFYGEGGKFIVRYFLLSNTGCEFIIDSHASIKLTLNIPSQISKKITKYFLVVPQGKTKVCLENSMVSVCPIAKDRLVAGQG